MPLFRKKPVVVEAVRFDPDGEHRLQLPTGVIGYPSPGADNWAYSGCKFFVTTIHGHQTPLVEGDWISTEPNGKNHYPCKHEIFEATYDTYEPV